MEVYLALGSNLGDRKRNIRDAVDMLDSLLESRHCRMSSIMESESWGFEAPPFLDAVVVYHIPEPEDHVEYAKRLLGICKEIERRMGRKEEVLFAPDGSRIYHDRIIDVDILFMGTYRVNLPDLTIPHALISQREFVLNPLREVVSDDIKMVFCEIIN